MSRFNAKNLNQSNIDDYKPPPFRQIKHFFSNVMGKRLFLKEDCKGIETYACKLCLLSKDRGCKLKNFY